MKPAVKKYMRDLIFAFTMYTSTLVNTFLANMESALWIQIMLVMLPAVSVILVLRAVIIFSKSWDELQRRQMMEAILIAFILVGMTTFAYGFLEGIGFPRISYIWVFPGMVATMGLAQIYVVRKYR